MKNSVLIIFLVVRLFSLNAQEVDTIYLYKTHSKNTITYKRIVQFDKRDSLYHVQDYYPGGQIQMKGTYSSLDKRIKEKSLWCNYRTNTKEGEFKRWYKSGQIESKTNFLNGLRHGLFEYWYTNGQRESIHHFLNGQEHGTTTHWDTSGILERKLIFKHGINQNPKDTNYHYVYSVPKAYDVDTLKKWPLVIYLHGGSSRGTDTIKLYCCGIPDQIWRGREFPFIVVAPQCPIHHRWSTDNWFENFYKEVTTKFRADTTRIYLTGVSLGGAGTWYLATKYPDKFAAIAPISGFSRHIDYIMKNTDKLIDIPIWTFHGKLDKIAEFEDTEWMVNKLKGKNKELKFSDDSNGDHGMYWSVYPKQELYDWFLMHKKDKN